MAIDYIDTTDKNEDRSDRLTLSHDAFMAHVAQCPPEDQERMNWLWGYLHNVLNRSKSRLIAELGQEWEDIRRYLAGGLPDYKHADMIEAIDSLIRRASRQKPIPPNTGRRRTTTGAHGMSACRATAPAGHLFSRFAVPAAYPRAATPPIWRRICTRLLRRATC